MKDGAFVKNQKLKTVAFKTFGCKLNQAETAMMAQDFSACDYTLVNWNASPDVAVINTCTVTGRADAKCKQAVRQALRANPQTIVLVTGCMSQASAEEIALIEGVDYVLGVSDKLALDSLLPSLEKQFVPRIFVSDIAAQNEVTVHDAGDYRDQTRAFLKLQSGCDRRCSYCIVPIVRGPSRSLPEEIIIHQFAELVQRDFKEIVLTGVHVGDYGKDKTGKSELPVLLQKLAQAHPETRIRLSSLDPDDIASDLLDVIEMYPNICRHFHIAMQSGSDAILRQMNRRHSTGQLRNIIDEIIRTLGCVGLGTDIITGFPGETEKLFLETRQFIQTMPFTYFHVFPFSPRKGTAAAAMKNQVPPKIRIERADILRKIGQEKKTAWLHSWVGETADVLLENRNIQGRMGGLTSEYVRVEVPFNKEVINQIVPVRINQCDSGCCLGILINAI